MTGDDIRRDEEDAAPARDRWLDVIRDLPRMRSMVDASDSEDPDRPLPAPVANRMGAVAQGCGGVLLTLVSIPMALVAVWYGFYMWGPGLLMTGGVVMLFATVGLWRGRRAPLLVSLGVVLGVGGLLFYWNSFLPAVVQFAPLGQFAVIYVRVLQVVPVGVLVLVVLHLVGLYHWNRLVPFTRRQLGTWIVSLGVLVAISLLSHFYLQHQRKSWLDEHLERWSKEAAPGPVILGGNVNLSLGFSFVRVEADDDNLFDVRQAELESMQRTGAAPVRLSASGDLLFEAGTPRIFPDDAPETIQARIEAQQQEEANFMALLDPSDLFLSDAQASLYLMLWAKEDGAISWESFARRHEIRVEHYAEQYHPAYYEIVTEPGTYRLYGIDEPDSSADRLTNWTTHTEDLIRLVRAASPGTRIGVTISLQDDFDLRFYERALAMEEIDFIGVRLYTPELFEMLEDVLDERGHPADFGKELWITHTWYGFCGAPQRSMTLDALWLETVVAFAAKERVTGVLANDHGCFIQPGGTWATGEFESGGTTEAWRTWRDLVARWQPR